MSVAAENLAAHQPSLQSGTHGAQPPHLAVDGGILSGRELVFILVSPSLGTSQHPPLLSTFGPRKMLLNLVDTSYSHPSLP